MAVYRVEPFEVQGSNISIVLADQNGLSALAAALNMDAIGFVSCGKNFALQESISEKALQGMLSSKMRRTLQRAKEQAELEGDEDEEDDEIFTDALTVLDNFRALFAPSPCLSSNWDFKCDGSYIACRILDLKLIHGWLIDPAVPATTYEVIKLMSYADLQRLSSKLKLVVKEQDDETLVVIQSLLDAYEYQLTEYGFNALFSEVNPGEFAMIFCRNRYDVIHNFKGDLYLMVADVETRRNLPKARWMLFEQHQEESIYFTKDFVPVNGQQHLQRAKQWYLAKIQKLAAVRNKEDKKISQQEAPEISEEAENASDHDHNSELQAEESCENGESQIGESSEQAEQKPKTFDQIQKLAAVTSRQRRRPGSRKWNKKDKKISQQEAPEISDHDHNSELQVEESCENGEVDFPAHGEVAIVGDNLSSTDGEVSEFLDFLIKFKDEGCSENYFNDIVKVFKQTESRRFYVPYEFLFSYNELLALKIQDNYPSIYEHLKEAVVQYLAIYGNCDANVELKIIGLPEPKSFQLFEDFIGSVKFHENYDIYEDGIVALPAADIRKMGLGYLRFMVAKFRTGSCGGGLWSVKQMKVKDKGRVFFIEWTDLNLTLEGAYADLIFFFETIFERLKHNGQPLPYSEEFLEDIMDISNHWDDLNKRERFFELISSPLALKPPLVRSAFISNVYLAANGNSSGLPPRYNPLYSRGKDVDWRKFDHPLLKKVYRYPYNHKTKKQKYFADVWSPTYWDVFKFARHFNQHVLENTRGDDSVQKIKDISAIDLLLYLNLGKHIARSVRFLVINCGVRDLFSSSWRHFVASECLDKPADINGLEDPRECCSTGQEISTGKMVGRIYSEVGIPSGSQVTVLPSEAELKKFSSVLNDGGFECQVTDDGLECGLIKLWKREKGVEGYPVVVVAGPYCEELTKIVELLGVWLGL